MPTFGPISRPKLIRAFRSLGFEGPFAGKKHQIMVRGTLTVRIPNPHAGDISRDLLDEILKQAEVTREEWEDA